MVKNPIHRIGIMGGTFNPIHNGHLLVAEQAREEFQLDRVLFLPNGQSPHKQTLQIAEASRRCDMIKLAIGGNPFFQLDLTEVSEKRISYTYLTLQKLADSYPETELYFILGADSLFHLEEWKNPKEIFANCSILAAYREGETLNTFQKQIAYLAEKYNARIYPLHMPGFDVSSSNIRNRIRQNQTIRYLVPDKVEAYIKKFGLYQEHLQKQCTDADRKNL